MHSQSQVSIIIKYENLLLLRLLSSALKLVFCRTIASSAVQAVHSDLYAAATFTLEEGLAEVLSRLGRLSAAEVGDCQIRAAIGPLTSRNQIIPA